MVGVLQAFFEKGLVASVIGVWALFPIGVALQWKVIGRLRSGHADVWQELGCPTNFPTRPRPALRFLRFLYRKEDIELGDPFLSRMCRWLRWFFVVFGALLLLGFASPILANAVRSLTQS